MNSIFYAHSGTIIRIACPHCRIVTKYDVDFIEEAIKEKKQIICIACEECFEIVLVPQVKWRAKE